MRKLTLALAAALALASTAATAKMTELQAKAAPSSVNTCYYQYSILTADGGYDVYYCYGNGDGSY